MDVERMQEHCLAKPGAWADNPWDHDYPVVKVGEGEHGKIFAFLGSGGVGLKCGPSRDAADDWLEQYPDDVKVMAYIGRSGWNDLSFRGGIPDDELLEAVDESYRLVVSAMPAKHRPEGWEDAVASPEAEPETEPEDAEADVAEVDDTVDDTEDETEAGTDDETEDDPDNEVDTETEPDDVDTETEPDDDVDTETEPDDEVDTETEPEDDDDQASR